jgi:hypothetical protein
MKAILKAIGCICFALVLTGVSQAQEWRGISPIRSTRADVEQLLGKSDDRKSPSFTT